MIDDKSKAFLAVATIHLGSWGWAISGAMSTVNWASPLSMLLGVILIPIFSTMVYTIGFIARPSLKSYRRMLAMSLAILVVSYFQVEADIFNRLVAVMSANLLGVPWTSHLLKAIYGEMLVDKNRDLLQEQKSIQHRIRFPNSEKELDQAWAEYNKLHEQIIQNSKQVDLL